MAGYPTLLLPVELQAREFDAKLLLACLAAERGFRALVGCHARMSSRIHSLRPSVFVAKGVTARNSRRFALLESLGHAVVAWDEEALVYMSPEFYVRRKVDPASLARARALFAWGEDNAAIWRGADGYAGQPLVASGNPRADLMRPDLRSFYEPELAAIRARFGRFVLVNSNFGGLNHYLPEVTRHRLAMVGSSSGGVSPEKVGTWDDPHMVAHRHALFTAFQEMVPALADAFPERRIVLRPHPSESHDVWRAAAAGRPNVQVVGEGNAVPWLLAADVVVQNGCTTGVEAYLLGRPVIAFQPFANETYDSWLPNALAVTVRDLPGLIDAVSELADGGQPADAGRAALARRFVAALEGPLAAERIVDAVAELADSGALFRRPSLAERFRGQLASRERALKKLRNWRRPGHPESATYIRHRFPDLSVPDVVHRVDRLRAASGRFATVRIRQAFTNIFELTTA